MVGIRCVHYIERKDFTLYSWVTRKGFMSSLYKSLSGILQLHRPDCTGHGRSMVVLPSCEHTVTEEGGKWCCLYAHLCMLNYLKLETL